MNIAIATDHTGVEIKKRLIKVLEKEYNIIDMSEENYPTDDYPTFAFKVAEYVRDNDGTFGILLCGTGIGMSIAANKVKGIRCALVSNENEAILSREHNNANIIAISFKENFEDIVKYIKSFLTTKFSNEERHIRRINLIREYEGENN